MTSLVTVETQTYLEYIGCNYKRVPRGHWEKKENHKIYCEYLFKKLGYTTMDDWYKISAKDIHNNYGCGLLRGYYNASPCKLLIEMNPNYNWVIWKFKMVPRGYWKDIKHHKEYMEWLKQELGYTTPEDWYKISGKDIKNNYGSGLLLSYYNDSHIKLVIEMYPKYNWVIWKFQMVPQSYWKDIKHHKEYMEWLKLELGYTTMEDWYKISEKDIYTNYGSGLLTHYYNSSPIKLVTSIYPNYEWDKSKFINNKTEGMILRFLLNNISNLGITNDKFDQYKPDWCINPDTNRYLPYDFYIELVNGKKIIIECDGEQHYTQNSHFHRNDRTLEKQQDRDIYKMNKALENDVSMIRIHQEEVWNDTIDWKKEVTDAINEIKNENKVTIKLLGCLKDKIPWEVVDSE